MLLYEMLTGLPPYYDENTNEMYRKILSEPLHFPGPEIVPPIAKDLLAQLLDRNPERRLGAKGPSEIKAHSFFNSIDWRKLLQRKYDPTFKPSVVRRLSRIPHMWALTAAGRCTGHGQLRQRIHAREADRLVCGRADALTDDAATICRVVVQPSGCGSRRRWRECQGPLFWQCKVSRCEQHDD